MLRNHERILFAPNGNGAIFQSTNGRETFEVLKRLGVEYVHITGVDNILNKWADPSMLGMFAFGDYDIVCKYGPKKHAKERVGVFAYADGKPAVIEYSVIGDELATSRDEKGQLLYNHSNLLNFMMRLSFIRDCILNEDNRQKLNEKYNVSIKDVKNYDRQSMTNVDSKGVKFELFIHECFILCQPSRFLLLECDRDQVRCCA